MGLDHSDWLGMSVRNWLGEADDLLSNDGNVSQGLAWRVGLKIASGVR